MEIPPSPGKHSFSALLAILSRQRERVSTAHRRLALAGQRRYVRGPD